MENIKARSIEAVDLCVTGPADRMEEALAQLAALGFARKTEPDALPWREALGIQEEDVPADEVFKDMGPGNALRGARGIREMTQKQLAAAVGCTVSNISDMEHNRRAISKDMARKLGEALEFDYRVFL